MTEREIQFYLLLMINVLIASDIAHPNQYWSALGFRPPGWLRHALPLWMTMMLTIIGLGLVVKVGGPAALILAATVFAMLMYGAWTHDNDE